MSDPIRILSGDGTEFERELLRTWGSRQPSAEAKARVMALAGVGVAAGLVTAASGAGASVAPKAAVASGMAVKWLAIGALGATVAAGAAGYVLRTPPLTPGEAPVAAVTSEVPRDRAVALPSAATSAARALSATPQVVPPPVAAEQGEAPVARPVAPMAAVGRVHEGSTLDEEVGMMERARRAVASGDGVAAVTLVDAYDAKFPGGSLSQESAELRIEAYVRQGDRSTAERLAARFVEAHPSSPYVRRIRALLADTPPR